MRDGVVEGYRAEPDPAQRATINELMRTKYGWRDAYISFWFSRDDAVPVRLTPDQT